MSLRVRLIVAFFFFSVVPLAAVTFYSYASNVRALEVAAQHETEMLTAELTQRMQVVTSQISERVQHLMDMPVAASTMVAAGTAGRTSTQAKSSSAQTRVARASTSAKPASRVAATPPVLPSRPATSIVTPVIDEKAIEQQVATSLGEVAMLLNNVEVRGMGRFGGPPPGTGTGAGAGMGAAGRTPPGAEPDRQRPDRSMSYAGRGGDGRGYHPTPSPGQREDAGAPSAPNPPGSGAPAFAGPPPPPAPPNSTPGGAPNVSFPDPTQMRIDLAPIRRELFREMAPNGSFDQMTPEERQRVGREVNQRLLGIVQGMKLSAAEIQKKAVEQRDAAVAARANAAVPAPVAPPAPVVPPPPAAAASTAPAPKPPAPAKPMTRKSALTGTNLAVKMESNGQVVGQVNAEINLPNLLATVFANTRRDSGEIPFAVGKDGHLYAPNDADRGKLNGLDVIHLSAGTTRKENWIIVTMPDESGAGLKFGIARPVGNLVNDLRRTTARNAGFGLLFIAVALVAIVPLAGRLTRNLSVLTDGVGQIAKGDYRARVPVQSHDEIGRLAEAFNRMAADVEQHQHAVVEQERIRRELELGRLIQSEMLPHAPLHLGLTEVKGVSVPAREVGGDFFNYFELDSGVVALLVGDVSGKGVGAALLMANIQASLRTRFALGQELSAIAEAIDRDIEANSPGPVYATLFMAIFDPQSRKMRYVNAGHNPQFVLRSGGQLEKMWSTGLPVGMLAGHGYGEREVQLATGDLLFFYTDGVVEMENEVDDMFGSDRLESIVSSSAGSSADQVLMRVETAISAFRGHRDLYDDATMMAVTVG
jgi:serine phosphatase RsbU (regulator of sigma subunit)